MRTLLLTGTLTLLVAAVPAHAGGEYTASIRGCEAALAERLGVDGAALRARLDGVDSSARYRDLDFRVSTTDAAHAQDLRASCRVRKSGEVLSLALDPEPTDTAVAAQ
jgi:hypothetical protein